MPSATAIYALLYELRREAIRRGDPSPDIDNLCWPYLNANEEIEIQLPCVLYGMADNIIRESVWCVSGLVCVFDDRANGNQLPDRPKNM